MITLPPRLGEGLLICRKKSCCAITMHSLQYDLISEDWRIVCILSVQESTFNRSSIHVLCITYIVRSAWTIDSDAYYHPLLRSPSSSPNRTTPPPPPPLHFESDAGLPTVRLWCTWTEGGQLHGYGGKIMTTDPERFRGPFSLLSLSFF